MKKSNKSIIIGEVPTLGLVFADVLAVGVLIILLLLAYSFFFQPAHLQILHTRTHQNTLLNAFEDAFGAEIAVGSIRNEMRDDQVRWGFHSNLLYANDSEVLSESGKRVLSRCSVALEQIPDSLYQQIQVIAFTKGGQLPEDSYLRRGGMSDYFDLAAKRAKNTTNYLVRNTQTVLASRFNSSMQRVAANALDDRKVEIIVYLH
ncbi:MAG: hypothetical protein ACPGVB_12405 [Chitinophagales bacterium]